MKTIYEKKELVSRVDFGMKIPSTQVRVKPPLVWHFYWWDILDLFSYLDYMWDDEEILKKVSNDVGEGNGEITKNRPIRRS